MATSVSSDEIPGMREVLREFAEVQSDIKSSKVKYVLKTAMDIVTESAKEKAPIHSGPYRGRSRTPGTLRDNIKTRTFTRRGRPGARTAVEDPIAHLIEQGHRTRKGKRNKTWRGVFTAARTDPNSKEHVAPIPYLRPAVDENEENVLRRVTSGLSRLLFKAGENE